MGLRESRIINTVHPWLGARLKWLEDVARVVGSVQSLISGNRTREEQLGFYNAQSNRPAAFPGCSQHQYGFAADANYLPISLVSSKGRPAVSTAKQTTAFFNSAARHVGLTVVANDDGHYQVFNGSEFKAAVVSLGLCNPNPPAPLPARFRQDPRPASSQTQAMCGTFAVGSSCNHLTGCTCFF